LSLYEWCLKLEHYYRSEKKENELKWVHTREVIAALLNTVRDSSKKPEPFKGTDIIKLSFDEEKPVDLKKAEEDNAEYFRRVKKKFNGKK